MNQNNPGQPKYNVLFQFKFFNLKKKKKFKNASSINKWIYGSELV